jgi:hypothetical protein
MVATYDQSRLWKEALENLGDGFDEQRGQLREAYAKFHQRASVLAAQIAKDLPALTVHNADHFNGLWHLASEIAGPGWNLNPAEAFVFGGTIAPRCRQLHCRFSRRNRGH